MTTYFVTHHSGAVDWVKRRGIAVDRTLPHLDSMQILAGDTVIGTLPVNLAALVCSRGARFYNLSIDLPADVRGKELSAADLDSYGARIEEYFVRRVGC